MKLKKQSSENIGKKEKKGRKTSSKEELNTRRKKIYDMVLEGTPQSEIAKKFKITRRTVEKDIHEVRKAGGKKFELQTMLGKMHDYDKRSNKRLKKLWKIIKNGDSTNDERIRAIKELRSEDVEAIKREQIAGIIPKEASPLVSVETTSKEGPAESKVQINIIAPSTSGKKDKK